MQHIECNKEGDKAPTNQVYLHLPAGFSVKAVKDLVRRKRGISAVELPLFIGEEEIHWRLYTLSRRISYSRSTLFLQSQKRVFYKSVKLVGVKAL